MEKVLHQETREYDGHDIDIVITTGAETERSSISYNLVSISYSFGIHIYVDSEEIWGRGTNDAKRIKAVKRKGIRQAKALIRSMQ